MPGSKGYKARIANGRSVGEVSSKYGYQPEKFVEDIQRSSERDVQLYAEFVAWMRERQVDPEAVRRMFISFYHEFID